MYMLYFAWRYIGGVSFGASLEGCAKIKCFKVNELASKEIYYVHQSTTMLSKILKQRKNNVKDGGKKQKINVNIVKKFI